MNSLFQHYIGGAWVDSIDGRRHVVLDPATEQPVTQVMLGGTADVDRAVAAARRAFDGFAQSSRAERLALLDRIIAQYMNRAADLAAAVSQEMGAPISFATAAQVPAGVAHFMATRRALESFAFSEDSARTRIAYEAIGVVGLITPWNWPLNQICAKLAAALAAGNTIVLKPSEQAPRCAIILAEILDAAGLPAGVFNLVNGDGPGVGTALSNHPDVDMISFTGSTRAGIAVAQAAAATVKRVHQELGGKAPNLILPGADLTDVLPRTVTGILANSGQSCIAPTRILVHDDQRAAAAAVIKAVFEATVVGMPSQPGNHIGPVANRAQFEKVQDLIQSAIDGGATLVTGGIGRPDGHDAGYFVRPTVFTDVTADMRIAREEVFGPVATIETYGNLDEGIRLANATTYGLSAVISGAPDLAATIAPRLRTGMVTINTWSPTPGMPFGGYKHSGNGREGGKHGMADFMEIKTIAW